LTLMSPAVEPSSFLADRGAALTLRGVRKAFGAKTVLNGVDLHVPAGQFLTVVGRSGCGKSTLLRLIAGLDEPLAGTIEVAGVSGGRARLTRIMFQEPRLLPWARVDANVAIGLGPAADHAEALNRSREALATVGWLIAPANGRQPCRVAKSNASRLRARSSAPRAFWRSMSRWAHSMR
jgi:sulfonate transport system ATP-binding protein